MYTNSLSVFGYKHEKEKQMKFLGFIETLSETWRRRSVNPTSSLVSINKATCEFVASRQYRFLQPFNVNEKNI